MSHKQAKGTRKVVRKEWRTIRDRLIEQIKELPLREQLKLFWQLLDSSPRMGIRFKSPRYFFIEKPKVWGLVVRFEQSWWVWDGNPMDIQNKGRDGWGLTLCGVRLDWRKEWVTIKPGQKPRAEHNWWYFAAACSAGVVLGAGYWWVLL